MSLHSLSRDMHDHLDLSLHSLKFFLFLIPLPILTAVKHQLDNCKPTNDR